MEAIFVLEDVAYTVYLQECGIAFRVERTAQIGYLVVESQVSLLPQHTDGRTELIVGCHLLFLQHRDNAVAEVQLALRLVLKTDGKDRRGTAESRQMACRLAGLAVGDDALHTQILCCFNGTLGKILALLDAVVDRM